METSRIHHRVRLPRLISTRRFVRSLRRQCNPLPPDGRFVAFVSERIRGEGERDVFLYDCQAQRLLATPGLNAKSEDFDPCVIVLP